MVGRTIFGLLALLGYISVATCCKVSYDDLGCFDSPLSCHGREPDSPDEIGTTFTLYTSMNPYTGTVLDRKDPSTITRSNFSPTRETKFLVHGWTDSMTGKTWIDMRQAFLNNYDVNVVMVDWSKGADKLYGTSRANTRVVGREIAKLIEAMNEATGASFSSMHIIGHSLGAHIGGYAGEACVGIVGRVTGLDPAGPNYSGDRDNACRLDKTDAFFVDILHTDGERLAGGGAGLMDQLGHQDFYPNGGQEMEGCPPLHASCDHGRAVEYFTESVSASCSFSSTLWADEWDNDLTGDRWQACSPSVCPEMGYRADLAKGTGVYYLETNADTPYCQG